MLEEKNNHRDLWCLDYISNRSIQDFSEENDFRTHFSGMYAQAIQGTDYNLNSLPLLGFLYSEIIFLYYLNFFITVIDWKTFYINEKLKISFIRSSKLLETLSMGSSVYKTFLKGLSFMFSKMRPTILWNYFTTESVNK